MDQEDHAPITHHGAGHEEHGVSADGGAHATHAAGGEHATHSIADFRRRFWVSFALTVPVLLLSPNLPFLGESRLVTFPGVDWVLLGLSTAIYF